MLKTRWGMDLLLLALLTSLLFGLFLGSRNLSAPDELRYSEIPREMLVHQHYVIPTLNDVKYLEKPPLFYWMQVAAIKSFGLNEWSLRFMTALMGVIGVLATYIFTRKIASRKTSWFAALALSSMSLYFSMAHVITLDMTVSVFISISLYAFFLSIKQHYNSLMYVGFIACAAAFMTKGLIALIFPFLIIGAWLTLFHRWHEVPWRHFFFGLLIFIALVSPWHLLAQKQAPEFFHFYFIEQQFLRYATSIAHRDQAFYFYIPVLILGTLPWCAFLPQSLSFLKKDGWKNRRQHEHQWFLLIWFLSVFLFFSLSRSKLIPYVLSGLPPLAILIAERLSHFKKDFSKKFILIYLIASTVFVFAVLFVDYFDNHTIKPLILKVKPMIREEDEVVAYQGYHQDLPFYFQRRITVDGSFDELEFGATHGDTKTFMIHEKTFQKKWESNRIVYVFLNKKQYKHFLVLYPRHQGHIVAEEGNNLVIVNHQGTEA